MNCSVKMSTQELCIKLSESLHAIEGLSKRVDDVSSVKPVLQDVKDAQKSQVDHIAKVVKDLEDLRTALKTLSNIITEQVIVLNKNSHEQKDTQELVECLKLQCDSVHEEVLEDVIQKIDLDGLTKVINTHTKYLEDLYYHLGYNSVPTPKTYSLNMAQRLADLEDNTPKQFFCTVLSACAAAVWAGAIGASISLWK